MSDSHTPPPEKKDRRRAPVVAIAVLMSMCMLSLAVIGPTTQEAEAAVPIVVIGGALAIGAIAGWIANDLMNDGKDANAEAAKAANAETYKASIINNYGTAKAFADTYATDKSNNYEADSLLLTRRAEYMARELYLEQKAAGVPFGYDANYVMAAPEMLSYIEAVIKSCSMQYTATYNTMEGTANNFYGDMGELKYIVRYKDTSSTYGTLTSIYPDAGNTNLKFLHIPAVYLRVDTDYCTSQFMATNEGPNGGTEILLISQTAGNVSCELKFRPNNTVAHTYTFSDQQAGQMNWVTLPENLPAYGAYSLSTQNMLAFSYAMKNVDSETIPAGSVFMAYEQGNINGPDICHIMLANSYADETEQGASYKETFAFCRQSNGEYVYRCGFNKLADLTFSISASSTTTIFSATSHLKMGEVYRTYSNILTTANVAANSYYNLLVETGDDQRYETMPDFLFPDPSQMEGLTVEEMYALLLVYRQQMADYYQNGAYMDLDDASFSPDSIGLYVRGALYNADGTPIYDDQAIWTPFVNVASQTLTVGENVTFDNSMTVLKWGEAAAIADFLEVNGTTANMRWNYPAAGAYAIIEEIYKDGAPIDEITLSLSNYEVLVPDIPDDVPPGQSGLDNTTATVNWLVDNWYWVCVGIGAVTVIAAALLRNSAVAGVGLLIILAGLAGYAATEVLPEWWESVKPWVISQDFWRPGP